MFNQTLRSLNLEASKLDSIGVIALAEALKVNQTLDSLDLAQNKIEVEGAKALANSLLTNQTLTNLGLYNANLELEGTNALAEALKTNHTLKKLHLGSNDVDLEGAKAFEEALKKNQSLICLYLHNVDFHDYSSNPSRKTKINTYLKRNRDVPFKSSKQVEKILIPHFGSDVTKMVQEYAGLPVTIKKKPSKIYLFLQRLVSPFQRFFKRIYKFIKNQWIELKNKISGKEPTKANATQTSPEFSEPSKIIPSQKESIALKEPRPTNTVDPKQGIKKSLK